ncbi:MAG: hypothetical protein LC114_02410 [Bryobacterales bacterium]|nr:hypothetical protein [Bryobacterales bacterium]
MFRYRTLALESDWDEFGYTDASDIEIESEILELGDEYEAWEAGEPGVNAAEAHVAAAPVASNAVVAEAPAAGPEKPEREGSGAQGVIAVEVGKLPSGGRTTRVAAEPPMKGPGVRRTQTTPAEKSQPAAGSPSSRRGTKATQKAEALHTAPPRKMPQAEKTVQKADSPKKKAAGKDAEAGAKANVRRARGGVASPAKKTATAAPKKAAGNPSHANQLKTASGQIRMPRVPLTKKGAAAAPTKSKAGNATKGVPPARAKGSQTSLTKSSPTKSAARSGARERRLATEATPPRAAKRAKPAVKAVGKPAKAVKPSSTAAKRPAKPATVKKVAAGKPVRKANSATKRKR